MTELSADSARLAPGWNQWGWRASAVAVFVVSADWLFFDRAPGISVLAFALILAIGALVSSPMVMLKPVIMRSAIGFLIALLPIIEDCSVVSIMFALLGAAYFAHAATTGLTGSLAARLNASLGILLSGPIRALVDLGSAQAPDSADAAAAASFAQILTVWVVPLGLGAVFAWLFVTANPVLEGLVPNVDLHALLANFSGARVLFWFATLAATWSFAAMRAQRAPAAASPLGHPGRGQRSLMFGDAAMLRSLVVFNIIFAPALSRQSWRVTAMLACTIAVGVEMFRLVHTPALDEFRSTTPGALLLGRVFSLSNLPAYGAGIVVGLGLDQAFAPPRI